MSRRKRRVPAAVQEQLARKQKQSATLAELHSAVFGASARQQLKPLLKTTRPERAARTETPSSQEQGIDHNVYLRNAFYGILARPTASLLYGEIDRSPSVDPAKLEALKAAEPYKVAARVPDLIEVITGWRAWMLSKTGRLEALGRDTVWPARQAIVAECVSDSIFGGKRHVAPVFDCSCGIWAFKDLDRLVAALANKYSSVCALGTVSLWGRVIETENGYRAQYAYPSELWLLDESLEELGLIYDVPVRLVKV